MQFLEQYKQTRDKPAHAATNILFDADSAVAKEYLLFVQGVARSELKLLTTSLWQLSLMMVVERWIEGSHSQIKKIGSFRFAKAAYVSFHLRMCELLQELENDPFFIKRLEACVQVNPRKILLDFGFAEHPEVQRCLGMRKPTRVINWHKLAVQVVYRCDPDTICFHHAEQRQRHDDAQVKPNNEKKARVTWDLLRSHNAALHLKATALGAFLRLPASALTLVPLHLGMGLGSANDDDEWEDGDEFKPRFGNNDFVVCRVVNAALDRVKAHSGNLDKATVVVTVHKVVTADGEELVEASASNGGASEGLHYVLDLESVLAALGDNFEQECKELVFHKHLEMALPGHEDSQSREVLLDLFESNAFPQANRQFKRPKALLVEQPASCTAVAPQVAKPAMLVAQGDNSARSHVLEAMAEKRLVVKQHGSDTHELVPWQLSIAGCRAITYDKKVVDKSLPGLRCRKGIAFQDATLHELLCLLVQRHWRWELLPRKKEHRSSFECGSRPKDRVFFSSGYEPFKSYLICLLQHEVLKAVGVLNVAHGCKNEHYVGLLKRAGVMVEGPQNDRDDDDSFEDEEGQKQAIDANVDVDDPSEAPDATDGEVEPDVPEGPGPGAPPGPEAEPVDAGLDVEAALAEHIPDAAVAAAVPAPDHRPLSDLIESFKGEWGYQTIWFVGATDRRKGYFWGLCRFHGKNSSTGCKKTFPVDQDIEESVLQGIWMCRHWCNQIDMACGQQWLHLRHGNDLIANPYMVPPPEVVLAQKDNVNELPASLTYDDTGEVVPVTFPQAARRKRRRVGEHEDVGAAGPSGPHDTGAAGEA